MNNNLSLEHKNRILDFFSQRRNRFDAYIQKNNLGRLVQTCPSCGFPTLNPPAIHEICDICNWQNDGQDDHNADIVLGGPNGEFSLTDSRIEFGEGLEDSGITINSPIIQKPEMILSILTSYQDRLETAAKRTIEQESENDSDNPFYRVKQKLIEEIFKNK